MTWIDTSDTSHVWAQLSLLTDANNDVDFGFRASTQFPLFVSAETARALAVYTSTISEP